MTIERFVVVVLFCAVSAHAAEHVGANGARIWLPEQAKIKGLIVHRDYASGKKLYGEATWRGFAMKMSFAQVLLGKRADVNRRQGAADLAALDTLLKDAAKELKHPELPGLPFVTVGVSRGGTNGLMLAYTAPKRAIACVGFHGESFIGIERVAKFDSKIPVLYAMAAKDPKRNSRIHKHVREVMRRRLGALWTLVLHKGCRHNSTGPDEATLPWLETIIGLRLSGGKLKRIDTRKSLAAEFELKGANGDDPKFEEARVLLSFKAKSEQIWLPDKAIADAWLAMHKEEPKQ